MATTGLVGKRFGRYVVTAALARLGNNRPCLCRCDCGTERTVAQANLVSGRARSCGCLRAEVVSALHTTHGEAGNAYRERKATAEYRTWKNMKRRCSSPKARGYENYGGRGITVCERWESFENFLTDLGRRPSAAHTIERNDTNGPYAPGNCRWATRSEQARNTRRNVFVELNGKIVTITEAARHLGVHRTTAAKRLA